MNLDCLGVTTENSAKCVLFWTAWSDSVVFVTLTSIFLSIIHDLENDNVRLTASVNLSNVDTVPVPIYSDVTSANAVMVFIVIGATVMLPWVRTATSLALNLLIAFLTSIVKRGEWKRPCVVSMRTLFCLIKCKPLFGPVKLFITAKVWSPWSKLIVTVSNGFSNGPFATLIWKVGISSVLKIMVGVVFWFCPIFSERFH